VCQRSVTALATDQHDLTFAVLYMVAPGDENLELAASNGLPADDLAAPSRLPVNSMKPWPIAEVLRRHELVLIEDITGIFGDTVPKGAWDRATTKAAMLAVPASGETGRAGVLIVP